MPKITVITPTYNRANLLIETIESIVLQDFDNFEYLIIDDGSKDDTREIVRPYLRNKRIKYYYHKNMGEAGTVNRGWKLAKGELVVIVNSDDPVKEGFLRTLVKFMDDHPDVIVGYPDWEIIDKNGEVIKKIRVPEYDMAEMIVSHYCNPGPGAVIRKSVLKAVENLRDTRFTYISDLVTWWNLSFYGKFARVPHNIARWRSHEGATTATLPIKAVEEHRLLLREFFERKDVPKDIFARKNEAYKNTKLVISDISFGCLSRKSSDWTVKWFAFKEIIVTFGITKSHLKFFLRFLLGNRIYGLIKLKYK